MFRFAKKHEHVLFINSLKITQILHFNSAPPKCVKTRRKRINFLQDCSNSQRVIFKQEALAMAKIHFRRDKNIENIL